MNDLPTAIQQLLVRVPYSCAEAEYVHFRQDLLREWVAQVADANENGWELLRRGAISQLADEDADSVDRALSVLFVVGTSDDVAAVEPLLTHRAQHIRKAARTCLFELRQRR